MGGPLYVTLADIHMIRTEKDTVAPLKPKFYKRFVDDIYNRRKKGIHDELYERRKNYHPNIKLTVEINPNKFMDTEIIENEGDMETKVYRKTTKLPVPWASNVPKRYKRNTINTIASNLDNEFVVNKKKFLAADYPHTILINLLTVLSIRLLKKKMKKKKNI